MGGLLALPLFLAGCTPSDLPIEAPETVLEKSMKLPIEMYQANTVIDINFKDQETKQSGRVLVNVNEKADVKDVEKNRSEINFEVDADLKLNSLLDESLKDVEVEAKANVKTFGQDVFLSLTELALDGNHPEVNQIKGFLPLFVEPYLDEILYMSLEELESQLSELNGQIGNNQASPRPISFSQQQALALRSEIGDLGLLAVTKENGIKKITTESGEKIRAYHYNIEFQADKFEEFIRLLNEKDIMFSDEDLEVLLAEEEGMPSLEEMMSAFSKAFTIEMWIGQEDYFPYKAVFHSDVEKLGEVLNAIEKMDESAELSGIGEEMLDNIDFELAITVNNEPIKKVEIETPSKEDTLNLTEILGGAAQNLPGIDLPATPTSSPDLGIEVPEGMSIETMTDEQIMKMMEDFSEDDLEQMMQDFNFN